MNQRINGFHQIKKFYSIVFEQIYDIKPQHVSIYVFLINQNNRNNWVEWFKCPFDLAMAGACIGNKKTYYKCLTDLQEWGFIKYKKGVNNWKAPLISIEVLKGTSSDTAIVPQAQPAVQPALQQVVQQAVQQAVEPALQPVVLPIYKLITYNLKPLTKNINKLKDFLKELNESSENSESNSNDIEEIYKTYPSKCVIKGSSTGKTKVNKNKIKEILKTTTKDNFINLINRYVSECKKGNVYMKNFSTFLNNLPDYSDEETKVKRNKFSVKAKLGETQTYECNTLEEAKKMYCQNNGCNFDDVKQV
jgi:hypothetical protein